MGTGFFAAVRSGFERYSDFRGRSTRSEYWWWQLFTVVLALLVGDLESGLGALLVLVLLVPSLAVSVRRLHDTDRSGWWLLVGLVPGVGVLVLLVLLVLAGSVNSNRYGPPVPAVLLSLQ
jgi:uncharacterized membrane protein YhaH (DUF805 family)